MQINQKPNGQHFRITIEQTPLDLNPLLQLQNSLIDLLPNFTAKDPDYLHLTLLHLGIPQDIYYEIRRHKPGLTLESFMSGFMKFLEQLYRVAQQMPQSTQVTTQEIDYYGSLKTPAVALRMQRNPQLDQMQAQVFQYLVKYLNQNGITNPEIFIRSSRNFRHSPPAIFDPHITLGRTLDQASPIPAIPKPIKLTLGQPYLAHVTVI